MKKKIMKKREFKKIIKIPKYKDKHSKFIGLSDSQKQQIAESLSNFCIEFANKFDVQVFLCGGTFLGAYRDNDFIPYDDDLDLHYYCGESNSLYVQKKSIEICEYFKSIGRLGDWYNRCHYHIYLENKIYFTDIWPCWSENNTFFAGGPAKRIYSNLSIDSILPLKEFYFRNHKFMIPNKPEDFAEWMWGYGWKQPKELRHGYKPSKPKISYWEFT